MPSFCTRRKEEGSREEEWDKRKRQEDSSVSVVLFFVGVGVVSWNLSLTTERENPLSGPNFFYDELVIEFSRCKKKGTSSPFPLIVWGAKKLAYCYCQVLYFQWHSLNESSILILFLMNIFHFIFERKNELNPFFFNLENLSRYFFLKLSVALGHNVAGGILGKSKSKG